MKSIARTIVERLIRGFVEKNPQGNEKDIKERIDAARVVSFDVFDTLLKRDVLDPADIFSIVQLLYEEKNAPLGFSLPEARKAAETFAYAAVGSGETSLSEIYSYVVSDTCTAEKLACIEREVEVTFSTENNVMKPLFDYALTKGKYIILVSDMYLDKNSVEQMLVKAGYLGYNNLFLSSELGLRKQSGKLFPQIINLLGVQPHDIVHIGDSIKPDWYAAKHSGIKSVLIPRVAYSAKHKLQFGRSDSSQLTRSCAIAIPRNLAAGRGYFYRFGVEALGPVLYGLAKFVHEGLLSRGFSRIFFMARDGYALKQAFEIMFPDEVEKCSYLYASRRSIGIPSVYSLTDLIEVGPTTRLITVTDFLQAVGVDGENATELAVEAGYGVGSRLTKLENLDDSRFEKLCEIAFEEMKDRATCQRELVVDYLRQEDVNDEVAVFDLGWSGNVQGFMNRILNREFEMGGVFGFYLGLDKAKCRKDIECDAYLGFKYPSMYLELVELCFSSHEGTTTGFVRDSDGNVRPRLAEYEYRDLPESDYVRDIQHGALDYVRRRSELGHLFSFDLAPSTAFSVMESIGTNPCNEDLTTLCSFRFEDNGSYVQLATPKPIVHYLIHPKTFMVDFEESRWKVGFVKKLFRLPLPYYRLLSELKEMRSRKYMINQSEGMSTTGRYDNGGR